MENRTYTQFLSFEGDRNPAVSICDERCSEQKLRPWKHNGGSTWLNPKWNHGFSKEVTFKICD